MKTAARTTNFAGGETSWTWSASSVMWWKTSGLMLVLPR